MMGYVARLVKDVPGLAEASLMLHLLLDGIDAKPRGTTVSVIARASRG